MFAGNSAFEGGGVRFCFFMGGLAEPTVRRNVFIDNHALNVGGGIAVYSADPVIENCTLEGNSAGAAGGGFHAGQCEEAPHLVRTIVANSTEGGGVSVDNALIVMSFCDVWNNEGGDYLGCAPGITDISADPLYCEPWQRDLRLRDDSPCLPAGNPWGELIGAYGAGDCGLSVEEEDDAGTFSLAPPFPNPASGPVSLTCTVEEPGEPVELLIVSVDGRVVKRLESVPDEPGNHTLVWDATDSHGRPVGSGVYLVRARSGGRSSYRGLVLVSGARP